MEKTIDIELLQRAQNKVFDDYKALVKSYKSVGKAVNDAFAIAHYNEIADFFLNLDDEEDWITEEDLENVCNYEGNVVKRIFNIWLDYNHPERYNFFAFEDFLDIIKYNVAHL